MSIPSGGREYEMNALSSERVRQLVLAQAEKLRPRAGDFPGKARWRAARATGTQLWLDTGDLDAAEALWCSEFSALTTNNTLLNREVQKGTYDGVVREVWGELKDSVGPARAAIEVAFVLNAVHALRLVGRFDAMVSVELHTDLAEDVEATVEYARRYYAICPESFIVKVPLTPAGLIATRRLRDERVPVNFTLGFSARQNFLAAALARPSYVNVFLGRLNSFVADHGLGDGRNVGERATLASQRAVREVNEHLGTTAQQIAASMRNGEQVISLLGVDVFTMPTKVAEEYEAMDVADDQVRSRVDEEPEVNLAPGVDAKALTIPSLWDVPAAFKAATMELAKLDPSQLAPDSVRGHFAKKGFPGLLPDWSDEDVRAAREDGKIPKLDRWKERLATGEIALDALMNLSALMSFATDQAAMDERIMGLLGKECARPTS